MILNDLKPHKYVFFGEFFDISGCSAHLEWIFAEITFDRPRQPAYEIKLMLSRVPWALAQISCLFSYDFSLKELGARSPVLWPPWLCRWQLVNMAVNACLTRWLLATWCSIWVSWSIRRWTGCSRTVMISGSLSWWQPRAEELWSRSSSSLSPSTSARAREPRDSSRSCRFSWMLWRATFDTSANKVTNVKLCANFCTLELC